MKSFVAKTHKLSLLEIHPMTKKGGELYLSATLQIGLVLGEVLDEQKVRSEFEDLLAFIKEFESPGMSQHIQQVLELNKKGLVPSIGTRPAD